MRSPATPPAACAVAGRSLAGARSLAFVECVAVTAFPHHADMVGSLLRPRRLADARAEWREGRLPADELRPIEDEAITDVVAKEEAVGLPAVTDGEFRRDWWHLDFLAAI